MLSKNLLEINTLKILTCIGFADAGFLKNDEAPIVYKSNPTLFEWFSSPIVYLQTDFADRFRKIMGEYFSTKKSLYHYISMAEGNYREYLKTEMVRTKKYFYVLRPVLACRWILEKGTPPPMLFRELMESELPKELVPEVEKLLDLKMNSPEIKEIPRVDRINKYLNESIEEIKVKLKSVGENKEVQWEELNKVFLKEIQIAKDRRKDFIERVMKNENI